MPEPSPTKPRRSVVVAFTFTASTSSCSARAMFARMVSRRHLRRLGTDQRVEIVHPVAGSAELFAAGLQQHHAVGPLVGRVRVWKMAADIAQRRRAEHRIHDRVQQHVGV